MFSHSSAIALASMFFAQNASAQVCDGFPVDILVFENATLSSGTALQVGAIYDFDNVTAGVDAQIEILNFTNGASIANIDNDAVLNDNLNPQIIPNPAGGGYVGFRVSFLNATSGAPQAISFSTTQIDVDGDSATLREFVEFEDKFAQFTVDMTTELVNNGSGPSNANLSRFESTTSATAPGIDPTAEANVVRAIYTNVTDYEFTYGTLGAGGTTRLASAAFDCPNIPNPVNTIPPKDVDLVTVKALAASSSATPDIGDTITYEITVTNNGPDAAANITLTDSLPAGLTATGNNGSVTQGNYTGNVWSAGLLLDGESAVLTLEGTVDTNQGGLAITNTLAAATSDDNDPTTVGDDLTETINVQTPVIEAVDNDFTATTILPGTGGVTPSVFVNDTLNGAPLDPAAITASVTDDGRLFGATINADGTIDVPTGTVPGIYEVEYEICDINDPANCDTAVATIAVQTTTPDVLANPTVCGAWNTQGWLTYGSPASHAQVNFNSGAYANDPYVYLPMSRDANGRILTNFGSPAAPLTSGFVPDRAGVNLTPSAQGDADHQSEAHSFVYRFEGAPNTSETVIFDTVSGAEFTAHWVENSAGAVQSSSDFVSTRASDAGESVSVTLNYPADGVLFLNATIFDPTFGYGRPILQNYECPAPSLSMVKVADSTGPFTVGDVITYTYTITNDGNQPIRDVAINDTHNGSDPAPTPDAETLLTDAAPSGDSTDTAADGSWDVLAPGDVVTFTGSYTVTQTDAENL